jgi:hypothetical protein
MVLDRAHRACATRYKMACAPRFRTTNHVASRKPVAT